MIYCERCGFANREGSNYCNSCGLESAPHKPADEPLPAWLRETAVAGYLWKGDMLLPDWLMQVRPFREIFGSTAVILPPPVSHPVDDYDSDAGDVSFTDLDEDEGSSFEGDLVLIDELLLEPETAFDDADPAELHEYSPQAAADAAGLDVDAPFFADHAFEPPLDAAPEVELFVWVEQPEEPSAAQEPEPPAPTRLYSGLLLHPVPRPRRPPTYPWSRPRPARTSLSARRPK